MFERKDLVKIVSGKCRAQPGVIKRNRSLLLPEESPRSRNQDSALSTGDLQDMSYGLRLPLAQKYGGDNEDRHDNDDEDYNDNCVISNPVFW